MASNSEDLGRSILTWIQTLTTRFSNQLRDTFLAAISDDCETDFSCVWEIEADLLKYQAKAMMETYTPDRNSLVIELIQNYSNLKDIV